MSFSGSIHHPCPSNSPQPLPTTPQPLANHSSTTPIHPHPPTQAVHMLFEGTPERPWRAGEKRVSKMVFIGRELDRETFQEVFNNVGVGGGAGGGGGVAGGGGPGWGWGLGLGLGVGCWGWVLGLGAGGRGLRVEVGGCRSGLSVGACTPGLLGVIGCRPAFCSRHRASAPKRTHRSAPAPPMQRTPDATQCLADIEKLPSGRTYEEADKLKAAMAAGAATP